MRAAIMSLGLLVAALRRVIAESLERCDCRDTRRSQIQQCGYTQLAKHGLLVSYRPLAHVAALPHARGASWRELITPKLLIFDH